LILGVSFWVKLSDEDIANFEILRDVAIVTVLCFLYMGYILMLPGKYD